MKQELLVTSMRYWYQLIRAVAGDEARAIVIINMLLIIIIDDTIIISSTAL